MSQKNNLMKNTYRKNLVNKDTKMENIKNNSEKYISYGWFIWGAAALFYFYQFILRVSLGVMTHDVMKSYNVTSTELGVLSSYYYFSYAALQIPCGIIVDKIGPRKVITLSCILCIFGSLMFANGQDIWFAKIGRLLIGAGASCAFLSSLKVASDWLSPSKFVLATGLTSMVGVIGGTFGQRPFAFLVNEVGWRSSMNIAAVAGIFVALIVWLIVRDKKQEEEEQNITKIKYVPQSTLNALKFIATNPQCWLIGLFGCIMYLPTSVFAELWGTPYMMKMYNVDNEVASTANIMIFIGIGIGCPAAAWISNKIKSRKKVMLSAGILSFSSFLFLVGGPSIPIQVSFIILFVVGLCNGGQVLCFTCVKELNPKRISGTTIGFTNTIVTLSGVVFQPLIGLMLDLTWDGSYTSEGLRYYSGEDYGTAMWSFPAALLINCVVLMFIKETYKSDKNL